MNSEMALDRTETSLERSVIESKGFDRIAQENRKGLAQTSANGNSQDIAEVFERLKKQLFRQAFGIARNVEDAQDAVNGALVDALGLQSEGIVKDWAPWLNVVTRNKAISIVRGRKPLSNFDAELVLEIASGENQTVAELLTAQVLGLVASGKEWKLARKIVAAILDDQGARDIDVHRETWRREIDKLREGLGVRARARGRKLGRLAAWDATPAASGLAWTAGYSVPSHSVFSAPPRDRANQALFEYAYGHAEGHAKASLTLSES